MTDRVEARIQAAASLHEAQDALEKAAKLLKDFGDLRNYSVVSMLQHDVRVIEQKVASGETYI